MGENVYLRNTFVIKQVHQQDAYTTNAGVGGGGGCSYNYMQHPTPFQMYHFHRSYSIASHVKTCDWLVTNMTDWRLEVDLGQLNDWLATWSRLGTAKWLIGDLKSTWDSQMTDWRLEVDFGQLNDWLATWSRLRTAKWLIGDLKSTWDSQMTDWRLEVDLGQPNDWLATWSRLGTSKWLTGDLKSTWDI